MVPRAQSRGQQHSVSGLTRYEPPVSLSAQLLLRQKPLHYVYVLRCADDCFYVGSAQDLDSRVKARNDGRGCRTYV